MPSGRKKEGEREERGRVPTGAREREKERAVISCVHIEDSRRKKRRGEEHIFFARRCSAVQYYHALLVRRTSV